MILDWESRTVEAQRQIAALNLRIEDLRRQLNQATAELAAEKELEGFRSEFLGRLRSIIEGREGVAIQGDRFVFASEVLFPVGMADLSEDGKNQIRSIADLMLRMEGEFPESIDWVLRVDGHTDDRPIIQGAQYADNWELSQARSLSVVRFLVSELNFPESRLAAAGFGEHRPVNAGQTEAAKSQNRRIEFKLTEP